MTLAEVTHSLIHWCSYITAITFNAYSIPKLAENQIALSPTLSRFPVVEPVAAGNNVLTVFGLWMTNGKIELIFQHNTTDFVLLGTQPMCAIFGVPSTSCFARKITQA
ncbi:hypothetical protein CRM22_003604 [Opisthorchis felineus]|uniref:Uncharacterized protein n=1 Tax=Opisthorchis felineus TaxID=147828 RepID=A0A4S2M0E5_OPIFE|nr:hypothetical protein CRM22_003604 [Opisthorchis felineus]